MIAKFHIAPSLIRRAFRYVALIGLLLFNISYFSMSTAGQSQDTRKLKRHVDPEYPELARRMHIKGVARVQVKVAPDGEVKDVKDLGGNPVLLEALIRAVKKWRYEPAEKEAVFEVKYDFVP